MHRSAISITLVFLLFCISHSGAYGGSQQIGSNPNIPIEEVVPFAKSVEKYAAARGAKVFVLARLGSPQHLLPEGINFTHVGLAVYSTIKTHEGQFVKGYAIHNLYQEAGQPDRSRLVVDYPVDFFSGAEDLKAGIVIPIPKLQKKILESLDRGHGEMFHNPNYSIAANPFSTSYQNCTEHTLDILFSSIYSTDSLAQIKANQRAYFKAQKLEISPLKRWLAPLFSSAVRLTDHAKQINVATFTTIANFLVDHQLASEYAVLTRDQVSRYN